MPRHSESRTAPTWAGLQSCRRPTDTHIFLRLFDIRTHWLSAWRCLVSPELKDTLEKKITIGFVLQMPHVFKASDCYWSRKISISTQKGPRGSEIDIALKKQTVLCHALRGGQRYGTSTN